MYHCIAIESNGARISYPARNLDRFLRPLRAYNFRQRTANRIEISCVSSVQVIHIANDVCKQPVILQALEPSNRDTPPNKVCLDQALHNQAKARDLLVVPLEALALDPNPSLLILGRNLKVTSM